MLQILFCVIGLVLEGEPAWESLRLPPKQQSTHDDVAWFDLPRSLSVDQEILVEVKTGNAWHTVSSQRERDAQRVWFRVPQAEKPSSSDQAWSREVRWRALQRDSQRTDSRPSDLYPVPSSLRVRETEAAIMVSIADKEVLRYNKEHREPPSDLAAAYGRSAHLHPVTTLKGTLVTDEFPPDHAHQSGIFLAYPMTRYLNRELDFWNLAKQQGGVRFGQVERVSSGSLYVEFKVINEHVDAREAKGVMGDGSVAAKETWHVRVWNPSPDSDLWWMDVTSVMMCATDQPIEFPEYHYGGMAVRGAREWKPDRVEFLTDQGLDRKAGNHARTKWCQMSGDVGTAQAGLVMMTHPDNDRYPEPLRIHATMPYMVYTPSFLGAWKLAPGEIHTARYRFVVADGRLNREQCERLWQCYAKPWQATRPEGSSF